jgi:hypothetical protein
MKRNKTSLLQKLSAEYFPDQSESAAITLIALFPRFSWILWFFNGPLLAFTTT